MIKFSKTITIAVFALICIFSPVLASEFIEGMEDIPLMDGLEQIPNNNISFGNEETRFVEAHLKARKVKFAQIAKFYKETLPQLGWKQESRKGNVLHFERDMEILDIVQEKTSPLMVRITLKSKN